MAGCLWQEEHDSLEDSVRASVANVAGMSLAACENLMREATTTEAVAEAPAAVVRGGIQLHHADAELDFEQAGSSLEGESSRGVSRERVGCRSLLGPGAVQC